MRKKVLINVLVACLMMMMWIPSVSAASTNIRVVVNGERVSFPDAKPYMDENNRILIPIRFVSEELGAEVEWEASIRKVTITDSKHNVALVVGQKEITVNNMSQSLDTAATMKEQRTFVPLRFVSEALGAVVEWDSKAKTVYINNDGKAPVKSEVVEMAGFSYVLQDGDEHSEANRYNFEYIITKSKLHIYNMEHSNSKCKLTLQAGWVRVGSDFNKQCEEMEEVLNQKVQQDCVDKVMQYVKKKTSSDVVLEDKEFSDPNYRITIISEYNSVVEVTIYSKK